MASDSDVIKVNKNLAIANRSHVSCAQYAEGIYYYYYERKI